MSQTVQLIKALKKILRKKEITYADIAIELGLSESTVKRMFAANNISLIRFEKICNLAQVDLTMLLEDIEQVSLTIDSLTISAEKTLVANHKLLMLTQLLLNKWQLTEVTAIYDYSESEVAELLSQLDRLNIIALRPQNRIQMNLSRHFKWIENGPVQEFFKKYVAHDFFDSSFSSRAGELLIFLGGMLTRQNNKKIRASMKRLAREFDELCKDDSQLPIEETLGTGLAIAIRPWELSVFAQYRRLANTKSF